MARKQHKPRSKAFKAACYYQLIRLVDLDDEVSTARIPVRPETDAEFRDRVESVGALADLKQRPIVDKRLLTLAAHILDACALGLELGVIEKRDDYIKAIRDTADELRRM